MARNETYYSDWSHLLHMSKAVVSWLDRIEQRGGEFNGISRTINVAMLRAAIKSVEVHPL